MNMATNVQFIPCFIGYIISWKSFPISKTSTSSCFGFSISPLANQPLHQDQNRLKRRLLFSGCFSLLLERYRFQVRGSWWLANKYVVIVDFCDFFPMSSTTYEGFCGKKTKMGLFVSKRNAKNQLPLLTNLFSWNLFFARAFGGDSLKGLKIEWIVSTGLMLLWSLADLRTSWYERDPITPMFFPFLGGRKVHFLHSCRPSIFGPPEIHLC